VRHADDAEDVRRVDPLQVLGDRVLRALTTG
jgi:hypothetical protein